MCIRDSHSTFGIKGPEIVYIRPDGYIGLRTQKLHPQQLRSYLGQIYCAIESGAVSTVSGGTQERGKVAATEGYD